MEDMTDAEYERFATRTRRERAVQVGNCGVCFMHPKASGRYRCDRCLEKLRESKRAKRAAR